VEADHHHLVCSSCGLVHDVEITEVPKLPPRYRKEFHSDAVDVIFRGVCNDCAAGT
jgi:Fur family ferric uptake transcriptional regulator